MSGVIQTFVYVELYYKLMTKSLEPKGLIIFLFQLIVLWRTVAADTSGYREPEESSVKSDHVSHIFATQSKSSERQKWKARSLGPNHWCITVLINEMFVSINFLQNLVRGVIQILMLLRCHHENLLLDNRNQCHILIFQTLSGIHLLRNDFI